MIAEPPIAVARTTGTSQGAPVRQYRGTSTSSLHAGLGANVSGTPAQFEGVLRSRIDYVPLSTRPADSATGRLFKALANWWHESTDPLSSPTEKAEHPAYVQIIAAGKPMIPFLVEDLRDRGGDWYLALRRISGEDPVPPEHAGRTDLMDADWITWAAENRYIP
jgi:hypothetical protein